ELGAFTNRAPRLACHPHDPNGGNRGHTGSKMKTRGIIEDDLPAGDRVVVRDREEQRGITCETVLGRPGPTKGKGELLEGPLVPSMLAPALRSRGGYVWGANSRWAF